MKKLFSVIFILFYIAIGVTIHITLHSLHIVDRLAMEGRMLVPSNLFIAKWVTNEAKN